jgi:hypothetical protein
MALDAPWSRPAGATGDSQADNRIVFTPDPAARLYRFVAPGTLVKFFNGLVYPRAVASHSIPSWNQIHDWLRTLAQLRESMGTAA